MLFFQCLGTLNNVQKNLNKIGSKYGRIAAVWKKGIINILYSEIPIF